MAGGVSEDLIIRITANINEAIANLKQLQAQTDTATKQMGSSFNKNFNIKSSFKNIEQFAKLTGDATGGLSEKMNLVSGSLRTLVNNGKGATDGAKNLASMFSSLQKQSVGANNGIMGIVGNLAKNLPGMSQFSGTLGQISSAFPQLASAASALAPALIAVAVAYKAIVIPGVEFNAMLEQQAVAFKAMLRSGEQAQVMLSQLKALSLSTPIGLQEGAQSAKQLLAYGFAQGEIIDNLKMMKTVAGAVNVSLGDLAYVYGTLRSQGRAYTRDLMQFAMRGIPIYEYLGKTMGVTTIELKKMTEEGRVGFKEVEIAMQAMTSEGGKFAGMLEMSMKTTQGLKTQIKNTWALFTGDAAKGSSAVFKVILTQVLSLVRTIQSLGPTFNAYFSMLSGIAGFFVSWAVIVIDVFLNVIKFLQNIVLSIIDIVSWVATWVDKTLGISKAFKDAGKFISDAGNWLLDSVPILQDILSLAGKVGDAVKKWWDRDVKGASPIEYIQGEFTKGVSRGSPIAEGINNFFQDINDFTSAQATSTFRNVSRMYDLPVDTVVRVLANYRKINAKELDTILRNTQASLKVTADYWETYAKDVTDNVSKATSLLIPAVDASLTQVENALTEQKGFDAAGSMAKILGFNAEDTKEALRKPAGEIAGVLYEQIDKMRTMLVYQSGQGADFLDGLIAMWQKYNQIAEKEGKPDKTKEVLSNILQAYLEFTSSMKTVEGDFTDYLVDALNVQLDAGGDPFTRNQSVAERSILLIKQKYNDMYQELLKIGADGRVFAVVQQMEDAEIASEELKGTINELGAYISVLGADIESATTIQDALDLSNMLYSSELQLIEAKIKQAALEGDIATQIEAQAQKTKKLNDLAMNRMKMLRGDNAQGMADRVAARSYAEGNYVGGEIQSQVGGGTEIGQLLMGLADPMALLAKVIVGLILKVESIGKIFNAITTIFTDVFSIFDEGGELFKTLTPILKVFKVLATLIANFLVPIIEVYADYINTLLAPVAFIVQLLGFFIKALQPLIKIIMYIINPFLILGTAIEQLTALFFSGITLEEDRQKELEDLYDKELATLQNLYEVGALSGAQYEQRLAELKAKYAKDAPENTAAQSWMGAFPQMFEAFAEMGEALNRLMGVLKPAMDAIAGPLLTVLLAILNIFVDLVTGISDLITGVANVITGILTWNWDLIKTGFEQVLNGVLKIVINPIITLLNLIGDGIDWLWPGADFIPTIPKLATGTGMVPNDMMAMIHQGEGIIPKDFMDSIRSGDLALTGGKGGGGGNVYITVNAQGDIITERDLAKKLSYTIADLKRKGHL